MTTLEDIRGKLAEKIADIENGDGDPIFLDVFEYPNGPAGLDKYPVAVILPTGGSQGVVKDTGRTDRVFSFEVSIYQEQTPAGKTREEANDIITEAIDAFLISFDRDNNLDFNVSRVKVVTMAFDFMAANGPYFIAKFTVECEVLVQNYQ